MSGCTGAEDRLQTPPYGNKESPGADTAGKTHQVFFQSKFRVAPVIFVLGGECNGFFLTGTQSLLLDRFSWIISWIFDGICCYRPRQNTSARRNTSVRQIRRQIVADDRRKMKREVNNRRVLHGMGNKKLQGRRIKALSEISEKVVKKKWNQCKQLKKMGCPEVPSRLC